MPGKNLQETLEHLAPAREELEGILVEYQQKLERARVDLAHAEAAWGSVSDEQKEALKAWVYDRDDAEMLALYELSNSVGDYGGCVRSYKQLINVFLFCLGREDEVDKGQLTMQGSLILAAFDPMMLTYLGPDEQIWVGKGTSGDAFWSIKPSPAGNGVIVVQMLTRYYECRVWCGAWDAIAPMVTFSAVNSLSFEIAESSTFGKNTPMSLMGKGSFLVPVPPPTDPEQMGNYNIAHVHQTLPNYLRLFGSMSDGFIRWMDNLNALAMTLAAGSYLYADDLFCHGEGAIDAQEVLEDALEPFKAFPGAWAGLIHLGLTDADARMSLQMPGLYALCPRCRSHHKPDLPGDRRTHICFHCEQDIAEEWSPGRDAMDTYYKDPSKIKAPPYAFECSCGSVWYANEIHLDPMGKDYRWCCACRKKEA